jgi:hypothetical protein
VEAQVVLPYLVLRKTQKQIRNDKFSVMKMVSASTENK